MKKNELLRKRREIESQLKMINKEIEEIEKEKPLSHFNEQFSRDCFPLLPKLVEYELKEERIERKYRKRVYKRSLSMEIKYKDVYRYVLFTIEIAEDNTFPVLFKEGGRYNESPYKTLKSLQKRIDEVVTSEKVKTVITHLNKMIKNGESEKIKEGYLEIEKVEEMDEVRRLHIIGTLMYKGEKVKVSIQVSRILGNWKYYIFDNERHTYIKAPFGIGHYPHDEFVWNQISSNESFQYALENCSFKDDLMNFGSLLIRPNALKTWFENNES